MLCDEIHHDTKEEYGFFCDIEKDYNEPVTIGRILITPARAHGFSEEGNAISSQQYIVERKDYDIYGMDDLSLMFTVAFTTWVFIVVAYNSLAPVYY